METLKIWTKSMVLIFLQNLRYETNHEICKVVKRPIEDLLSIDKHCICGVRGCTEEGLVGWALNFTPFSHILGNKKELAP